MALLTYEAKIRKKYQGAADKTVTSTMCVNRPLLFLPIHCYSHKKNITNLENLIMFTCVKYGWLVAAVAAWGWLEAWA